jgi:hypothetical protein
METSILCRIKRWHTTIPSWASLVVWVTGFLASAPGVAQTVATAFGGLQNGRTLIAPGDLPPDMDAVLQKLGNRMRSAETAQVTLIGTTTDTKGSRASQIVVQAPGFLSYREGTTRAITFDGTQFQSKAGQITGDDQSVMESFLAHLPDVVCLQFATGGSWRRLGGHFRTDNGSTPNYKGPYWTVYAFSPANRLGLTRGQALQQEIFVAIEEQTWLVSEVRIATKAASGQQSVTQTQFSSWIQQSGQSFPGTIVRLENGKQVLSFQTTQASVSAAAPMATFKP